MLGADGGAGFAHLALGPSVAFGRDPSDAPSV